jgi:arylformamidase
MQQETRSRTAAPAAAVFSKEKAMVIDITQELFSCHVYPGDPAPQKQTLNSMAQGGLYNLTAFSMCAHNGTHIDAPAHFLADGRTVEQLPPEVFVGDCYVARRDGDVTAEVLADILAKARAAGAAQRILVAGSATLTAEAARLLAGTEVLLYGNESQSVGPEDAPMEVHKILLGADKVLLEGVVLTAVKEGKYFLSAAPLNLGGCEGAPCRAVLVR